MKKILITGASGGIAKIVRENFKADQLTLWSRNFLELDSNETWMKSEPLQNTEWWATAPITGHYDSILHLAEPVKKNLSKSEITNIIKSHVEFLSNSSSSSKKILYPISAYKYDQLISKDHLHYITIKNSVSHQLSSNSNVFFPVIHPLIDFGPGINETRKKISRLPLFNLFCSLESRIPILEYQDLVKCFDCFINDGQVRKDWFTDTLSISQIFNNPKNTDNRFLSSVLKQFLFFLRSNASAYLLLNGRQIK